MKENKVGSETGDFWVFVPIGHEATQYFQKMGSIEFKTEPSWGPLMTVGLFWEVGLGCLA